MSRTRPQPKLSVQGFQVQMSKRKASSQIGPQIKRQRVGQTTFKSQAMRRAQTPEMHYIDTEIDATGIQNIAGASWANCEMDPTALTLFAPVQGDDINNRTAKRAYVTSIKIRGFVSIAAQTAQATSDGAGYTRIILYQDQRTNGAQTQAEDVIASGSATLQNVCAFQNTNSFGKVKILKEKIFGNGDLNIAGITTSIEQQGRIVPFKFTVKFKKPVEVNFQTNGGTVASVLDNSFHVIAATNNSSLAQTLAYKCRVGFYS